jgi:ribonucleoside-diphosphate reductase alpha chain
MRRIQSDGIWSTFCPSSTHKLADLQGEEFEDEYGRMENAGAYRDQFKAKMLWQDIVSALLRAGGLSILFKDTINSAYKPAHRLLV